MLLIRHRVLPSRIHGSGLFADEPVAAGAVIWRFDPEIDQRWRPGTPPPPEALAGSIHHVYKLDGWFYFDGDAARYTNHADEPNSRVDEAGRVVAVRDIAPGEELTLDYAGFEQDWSHEDLLTEATAPPRPQRAR